MLNYNNLDELMNVKIGNQNELSYKSNIYAYKQTISNVQRGEFLDLQATDYYNEKERHRLTIYYDREIACFVESGYGSY